MFQCFFVLQKGKKLFFHLIRRAKGEGFTLVEVIIVVAIIGLVAAATIVAIRKGNNDANLRFAAQNLVSVYEQARTMTLSGKVPANETKPPVGGYGVVIFSDYTFLLFADHNDNISYDASEDQVVETVTLPTQIKFASLGDTVIFNPPDGEVKTGIGDQTITLQNEKSPKIARVSVKATTGEIQVLPEP